MKHLENTTDLRTFLPAKDFALSREFYAELGAKELWSSNDMVLFRLGQSTFYLQDYYVKDWAENLMMFLMVPELDAFWEELRALDLPSRYAGVRWKAPTDYDWGLREIHLIDPAGTLWHFAKDIG
ncbi:VOC family protein [Lewinella sp. W8]|uniref:VOC family protein n=1 Tax=Lewinella sp. W8 TaxID=2528208 RepID=UPI001068092B|nr:VOC family protein [Lewinella sp. W8]MTB53400.1 glyoxalase [Lewinella sp. W8]